MDVETAIRAFASAGHDPPRETVRWALERWEEAAPGLLGVLERYADGADRSKAAASATALILDLAAEKRETRAFVPLCRLAKQGAAAEAVLELSIMSIRRQSRPAAKRLDVLAF